jgi:hypothetical protein
LSQTGAHVDAVQVSLSHAFPQAPQLSGSVAVSTQLPPQRLLPPLHWQLAVKQVAPVGQIAPQEPQLPASVAVSAQLPPHEVWPASQGDRQVPATQAAPTAQACPQLPQFWALVATLTHALPHSARSAWHRRVQPPS